MDEAAKASFRQVVQSLTGIAPDGWVWGMPSDPGRSYDTGPIRWQMHAHLRTTSARTDAQVVLSKLSNGVLQVSWGGRQLSPRTKARGKVHPADIKFLMDFARKFLAAYNEVAPPSAKASSKIYEPEANLAASPPPAKAHVRPAAKDSVIDFSLED